MLALCAGHAHFAMSTFERAGSAARASLVGALREAVDAWAACRDSSLLSRHADGGTAAHVALIEAIAKQVLAFGPLPADIRPAVWSALLGYVPRPALCCHPAT
ncbi:MAG: hypothetical protein EOO41_04170 [Methanobacteriota archaeon]|nr:MAG: hypothetical protein EOO41_04170 [Euryarchaeota archaeon]